MINRQKHNWACGHVAKANAYKWLEGNYILGNRSHKSGGKVVETGDKKYRLVEIKN